MKRIMLGVLGCLLPLSITFAQCDLTQFRWYCKEAVQVRHSHRTPSMLDCNGSNVYVTHDQYEQIMRYQRAGVNMNLKVNGEFVSSPCVPAGIGIATSFKRRSY